MSRKCVTQIFPWLLPIRRKQRKMFFYLKMKLDANRYSGKQINMELPYLVFETSCPMYNKETGFDMTYQDNKVFNLKLAAKVLTNLVIQPHETFSFWKLVRKADKNVPFKDGLAVVDGKLSASPGGGLCQISNLLFWMFLHTPLTVVERHGHAKKDFPEPPSDALLGVDATVSEGWLDLKVRNDTEYTFQIVITFDEENIKGRILADHDMKQEVIVTNKDLSYYKKDNEIFEEVDVVKSVVLLPERECISSEVLYRNCCKIGYPLPDNVEVIR